ncbi:hypothetical protein J2W27_000340 [Variovorax boronicumulans]|uniref:Arc family DNA-binding protein n=1 Tax=Variovorax boronicumulans TaxID=436515 RepID=UPI0027817EDB|nr:Arc family DNA-binding protein [Variovorax boronicumulans]MDP9908247.1 hypothetical protein [Variovorax boronicumulans]
MKEARKAPAVMLRLPQELKDWLKHRAIDNRRSLNDEVLVRVEESRARERQAEGVVK